MNQELPRPIRKALAQPARGEVHPSPDVLTSFMERTLPQDERDRVTDHLALCAGCREAVFLASNAAEDVIGDNNDLQAAAHHGPSASVKPRRRWAFVLSWASAAVAVLLIAGALVWRFGSISPVRRDVSTVAVNNQPPAVTRPSASEILSPPETQGKTARIKTTPPKTASSRVPAAIVSGGPKGGEQHQSEASLAAAPTIESSQTPPSAVVAPKAAAPAPGTRNAFVEHQADILSQLGQAAAIAKPTMSMRAFQSAPGQWRVSADGHLERTGGADGWTRVLNNEATTFHVVSVVEDDVWAGGEGGVLFHSADNGQHWSRVPLITSSGAENGTIISIHFENSQQGTVLTAGGSRWSTSDGGVSWTSR